LVETVGDSIWDAPQACVECQCEYGGHTDLYVPSPGAVLPVGTVQRLSSLSLPPTRLTTLQPPATVTIGVTDGRRASADVSTAAFILGYRWLLHDGRFDPKQ
jgi:hypothetical protein